MKTLSIAALLATSIATSIATANTMEIEVNAVSAEGVGNSLGVIEITESTYGLVFTPKLTGLTPGIHGFHVHENPDCDMTEKGAAMKAGGHFDPKGSGNHGTPWSDDGHLGDLPALYVDQDGNVTQPVLAPKIKQLDEIKGRALMIHVGGDNHSDTPAALGGGGARMACGIIQ
ncbi:superoxide dismutase [Cu-Zn] SodC [Ignatzschineria rhizosphaerae]|uniref:Superoxide dismutase [Cu-Zn] n=1 Tax=Ignatzschineria rhizosphaerae TaxID=2923279 RepID=A0ABY3XA56_9GAMM|nr:superoxide dismutase [Cu-Zn] SodC [Ignatzschineria rhizosphaerae]